MTGTEHRFQVDLRGVVDLLSHHLYASPRVYVRELLQNAIDAITARRAADPDAPAGRVVIEPLPDGALRVTDNGIGLTEAEVHTFLASVGRTSKRDELGFARQDFLGQFGIGLLSCFMVADEIEVVTRSAKGGGAVGWTRVLGRPLHRGAPPARPPRSAPRSPSARGAGAEHWLTPATVRELASSYAHLLDVEVTVGRRADHRAAGPVGGHPRRSGGTPRGAARVRRQAARQPPDGRHRPERARGGAARGRLRARLAGPGRARAATGSTSSACCSARTPSKLVPEWAFFVRCVVDTSKLRPTASREALYEDDLLSAVRDGLGEQIRSWLLDLSVNDPDRLAAFLRVHHLGVKALAVHDDEMLRWSTRGCRSRRAGARCRCGCSAAALVDDPVRGDGRRVPLARRDRQRAPARRWSTPGTRTTPRSSSDCPGWTPRPGCAASTRASSPRGWTR